jgi:hypothetical protein
MGNFKSHEAEGLVRKRNGNEWIKIQNQGNCELWEHRASKIQYQAYPIASQIVEDHEQL